MHWRMTQGVENIATLLNLEKKRDIEAFARRLIVSQEDLAVFLSACDDPRLGIVRTFRERAIEPAHLRARTEGSAILSASTAEGTRARSHLFEFMRQREVWRGHMLVKSSNGEWHFIYFSESDWLGEHWMGGEPHLHFVNHLWPQHSRRGVWQEFMSAKPIQIGGALHIRFKSVDAEVLP